MARRWLRASSPGFRWRRAHRPIQTPQTASSVSRIASAPKPPHIRLCLDPVLEVFTQLRPRHRRLLIGLSSNPNCQKVQGDLAGNSVLGPVSPSVTESRAPSTAFKALTVNLPDGPAPFTMKHIPAALLHLATLGLAGVSCFASVSAPQGDPTPSAFFESKVRPVLLERCTSCHGEKVQQASLRLDTAEGLRKGADTGPVISPGDPEKSTLLRAVRYSGAVKMPPAGKLRPDEIAALEQWIRQGAVWPAAGVGSREPGVGVRTGKAHWSFQPVRRPAIPKVRTQAWVKTPIDAFILAKLEAKGLSPAPPADPRTLIRRVTFDLTGMPPTPEEVDAFVRECRAERASRSASARMGRAEAQRVRDGETAGQRNKGRKIAPPGAPSPIPDPRLPSPYERLVDRLLDSPHYGERWGRHWLDVVRYADTAGETADYPVREAYRYRDYVIQAFNADMPYDQFIREQVAGDLLAASAPKERYAECITATGFLAISRRFGFDPQNYQHLTIDDTIDTLGKSVLGLSLGCARCHDHKYDPVPASDYYGLYGIFASTRYAFPGSEEVKRPRDFVPLAAPSDRSQLQKAFDERLQAFTHDIAVLEGKRTQVRTEVGLDGDFEFQEAGSLPGTPWENGPNSPARLHPSAQSPYGNVYPAGSQGIRFGNAGGYSGFGQRLPKPWTATESRYLHYNIDFRTTSVAAGGTGSFRFYVGHGPGNSAAIELFVNGETLFARNGDRIEPVRPVKVDQWYNLSLVLDLQNKTYAGSAGIPGDLTPITNKQLAGNWNGTIDYYFVDSYGHIGGVRPGLDVDNLTVRDAAFPPLSQSVERPSTRVDRAMLRSTLKQTEDQISTLQRERSELTDQGPFPLAYAVTEGAPQDARILRRGDPLNLGDAVPRHFPVVLGGQKLPADAGSGRLQLAQWLTDPANPLTTRVIVNRVWQHHFGAGIVRTPNDFGKRGAAPTHPELLDWLAAAFSSSSAPTLGSTRTGLNPQNWQLNWSLKRLHRLILLSNTYQQASAVTAADPENRLFAHQNRRRLEAEAIRDAMLSVSGDLDPKMGGDHPFPPVSTWGFTQHQPFTAVYETRQRSVYLMTQRIRKHPFLALFDGAEPNASTPERVVTTTPLQALFMMNDPFAHDQARKLAARLLRVRSAESSRIEQAYRLCFGRAPASEEISRSQQFLTQAKAALREAGTPTEGIELSAWASFSRALLSSNEFLFID